MNWVKLYVRPFEKTLVLMDGEKQLGFICLTEVNKRKVWFCNFGVGDTSTFLGTKPDMKSAKSFVETFVANYPNKTVDKSEKNVKVSA